MDAENAYQLARAESAAKAAGERLVARLGDKEPLVRLRPERRKRLIARQAGA